MSGFRSIYNEHGDRATVYENDGQPDRVLKLLGEQGQLADLPLREAFARRGYVEKYERRPDTEVREEPVKKLTPVSANYRPAFSAARCGLCAHFQSGPVSALGHGTCELVQGSIDENSVCDLYTPKREDATEEGQPPLRGRWTV
jgi:hypothetical protein